MVLARTYLPHPVSVWTRGPALDRPMGRHTLGSASLGQSAWLRGVAGVISTHAREALPAPGLCSSKAVPGEQRLPAPSSPKQLACRGRTSDEGTGEPPTDFWAAVPRSGSRRDTRGKPTVSRGLQGPAGLPARPQKAPAPQDTHWALPWHQPSLTQDPTGSSN